MLHFFMWFIGICLFVHVLDCLFTWCARTYRSMADAYLIIKIKAKCLYLRIIQ